MQGSDNRSLLPMAEAAHQALGQPAQLNVVADAGFSNGAQAETASVYSENFDAAHRNGEIAFFRRTIETKRLRIIRKEVTSSCLIS
jgi:hypothetical protein